MHKKLLGLFLLVVVLAMFVVEPGYARKRAVNAVPEEVFIGTAGDVTHEVLAVRINVRKIDNYKLDLSIKEVTANGDIIFLESQIVTVADLTHIESTKKSVRVDVTWPETELIAFDSHVRCCAQVIEVKKDGSERLVGDMVCIDLYPILE